MNDFTASNGIHIRVKSDRLEYGLNDNPTAWKSVASFELASRVGLAVREFFQAEADGRLGRWRWPEHPDYVVYHWDQPQSAGVVVVSETGAVPSRVLHVGADPENPTPEYRAARAYFDAHPEPKPWHDAAVGDAWVLNTGMGDIVFSVVQVSRGGEPIFVFTRGTAFGRAEQLHVDDPGIQSGRRIWPEVSS